MNLPEENEAESYPKELNYPALVRLYTQLEIPEVKKHFVDIEQVIRHDKLEKLEIRRVQPANLVESIRNRQLPVSIQDALQCLFKELSEQDIIFTKFPAENLCIESDGSVKLTRSGIHNCIACDFTPLPTNYIQNLLSSFTRYVLLAKWIYESPQNGLAREDFIDISRFSVFEQSVYRKGKFASFYTSLYNGKQVLLKVAKREEVLAEYVALKKVEHPYIVQCFGLTELKNDQLALVIEFYPKKNLRQCEFANNIERVETLLQVLDTLEFLHMKGIVHGNLTPSKILFAADGSTRLSNFLLSSGSPLDRADYTSNCPTMAPQTFTKQSLQPSADLWSFAVLIYFTFTNSFPFREVNATSLKLFYRTHSTYTLDLSENFIENYPSLTSLLTATFQKNPDFRPSLEAFRRALESVLT